jgi:hypothetical protein
MVRTRASTPRIQLEETRRREDETQQVEQVSIHVHFFCMIMMQS